MRKYFLIANFFVVMIFINYSIIDKEILLQSGTKYYLELAPVDPRSLMQGDYMILNYKISTDAQKVYSEKYKQKWRKNRSGYLILSIHKDKTLTFKSLSEKTPNSLKKNTLKVLFKAKGSRITIGAESFFFPEGKSKKLEDAKYAEIVIGGGGKLLISNLLDINFKTLSNFRQEKKPSAKKVNPQVKRSEK